MSSALIIDRDLSKLFMQMLHECCEMGSFIIVYVNATTWVICLNERNYHNCSCECYMTMFEMGSFKIGCANVSWVSQ
jgi:hypothetical protein